MAHHCFATTRPLPPPPCPRWSATPRGGGVGEADPHLSGPAIFGGRDGAAGIGSPSYVGASASEIPDVSAIEVSPCAPSGGHGPETDSGLETPLPGDVVDCTTANRKSMFSWFSVMRPPARAYGRSGRWSGRAAPRWAGAVRRRRSGRCTGASGPGTVTSSRTEGAGAGGPGCRRRPGRCSQW